MSDRSYMYDIPDQKVLTDEDRVARKPHRCDVCKGSIVTGEKYRYVLVISDGELLQFKDHLFRCWEANEN